MKSTHKAIFGATLILLLCFVVSCHDSDDDFGAQVNNTDYTASEAFLYSFDPAGLTHFMIGAISGEIEIHCVADSLLDSIRVSGERRVESESQADATEHLAYLHVLFTEANDSLSFKTDQPDEPEGRNYYVDYYAEIPESLVLTFSQVNGPLRIQDMANSSTASVVNGSLHISGGGSVIASIVNGQLNIEHFNGSVTGSSVNGGITADLILPEAGVCDLHVTNGNLGLTIPSATSAAFSASVVHGLISYTNLTLSDATITLTSVNGILGAGNGAIDLSTANGNITVIGVD